MILKKTIFVKYKFYILIQIFFLFVELILFESKKDFIINKKKNKIIQKIQLFLLNHQKMKKYLLSK